MDDVVLRWLLRMESRPFNFDAAKTYGRGEGLAYEEAAALAFRLNGSRLEYRIVKTAEGEHVIYVASSNDYSDVLRVAVPRTARMAGSKAPTSTIPAPVWGGLGRLSSAYLLHVGGPVLLEQAEDDLWERAAQGNPTKRIGLLRFLLAATLPSQIDRFIRRFRDLFRP